MQEQTSAAYKFILFDSTLCGELLCQSQRIADRSETLGLSGRYLQLMPAYPIHTLTTTDQQKSISIWL